MADEEVSQEVLDGVEGVDEELEAMKSKVKEMEEEAEKLRKIQEQVEDSLQGDEAGGEGGGEDGATDEADARSVYVGQVDYSATPEELQEHFASCGTVNRVTIICDRFGNPKGFAYIEFAETEAVEAAVVLNDSEFKGRQLKVTPKRTNMYKLSNAIDEKPASASSARCSLLTTDSGLESAS
ncbi:polyadenylate-binding protein 2-like protein [Chrysochromulina tobinii]|uniref:Polyadenylate-binding protein 2-like protein n=1 Tax=Chrysochromulina tobinii TaxID=1460289 RepID=A0A0M0JWU5_9EUKA|nr:polyadenylate-binding protein 2-like protein [Chrysochromulina tobinii]|eukprot:KOO31131.1 polyadenylate-binding protein 2-like protein [Chrysochromulina sp. CCMP291]